MYQNTNLSKEATLFYLLFWFMWAEQATLAFVTIQTQDYPLYIGREEIK